MGVDVFSVNLDKPSRQYSPGETISGKVFIRIYGEETTVGVTIGFFGRAHTHWREEEHIHHHHSDHHIGVGHHGTGHSWTETVYHDYDGNETLFDFAVLLYGDNNNTYRIPPGDNVFPFAFQVPARPLPVSCNFEDGNVIYGLEGRIRKPWYKVDPKTQILPVTLFTIVDLNITPGARNPMAVADSRVFGSCCCPSQPCTLRSYTPKLGYIPGEQVPFVVEIQNQSDQVVYNLTATLTQVWSLFAYGHHGRHMHTHPMSLQTAVRQSIAPGEVSRWDTVFTIPPTVPPTPSPRSCDLFQMEYHINVSAAVEGCCGSNDNFGMTHPIIVGTVPLNPPAVMVTVQNEIPKYKEKGGLA